MDEEEEETLASVLRAQEDLNVNDPQQEAQSFTKRKLINASVAKQLLKNSILEAARDLTHEFHGPYLNRLLMSDIGRNLLDSTYPASSFDAVKKGFLFHLNSTGHYLSLREHLRQQITHIIQQCGLISRPNGFQNHHEFQTFLHDMYIYLCDEMHDTLNETGMTELEPGNYSEISENDLLLFAEEAMLELDLENSHRLHLQRICRISENPQSWLDFAIMWCQRGDDRMAEIAVREALKLDPKCVLALLLAGIIAARHRDDRSIKLIGAALEICPLSPEIYVILAAAHRLLGNQINCKYFFLKARLLHLQLTGRDFSKVENEFNNFSFLPTSLTTTSATNSQQSESTNSQDVAGKKTKSKVKKIDRQRSADKKKGSKNNTTDGKDEESTGSKKSGRGSNESSKKSGRKRSKTKKKNSSEVTGQNGDLEKTLKDDTDLFTRKESISGTKPVATVTPPPKPLFDLPIDISEETISQMFLPKMSPSIQFTWDMTKRPWMKVMDNFSEEEEEESEIILGPAPHYQVESREVSSEFMGESEIIQAYEDFVNGSNYVPPGQDSLHTGSAGFLHDNSTLDSAITPRSGKSKKKKTSSTKSNDSSKELSSSARKKKKARNSKDSINNLESGRSSKKTSLNSSQSHDKKKSPKRKRSSKAKHRKHLQGAQDSHSKVQDDVDKTETGSRKVWTTRNSSEYIWTAQLLLQLHAHDFLDGVLARELFYTESRSTPFLYILAMSLLNRKREKAALVFIEEALSYDSNNPYIWELKGNCLHALGQNDLAIQCFQKSIAVAVAEESSHNRHLTYLRFGSACMDINNVKLAKSVLLKGVSLYPSLYMWIALGNLSKTEGNYAEAEASFAQANRRDNTNPTIWGQLSIVSLAQGNRTLAEQCYKWARRFGLGKGPVLDEIKHLQEENGWGDPSFPRVPNCIPHEYYLKRLGRQKPLDIYREAIETPENPNSRLRLSTKMEETSREKELKRRLKNWKKGKASEEEDEEEMSQEEEGQEEMIESLTQNVEALDPYLSQQRQQEPWNRNLGQKEIPFSRNATKD